MDQKYLLSPNATNKYMDVKEATEILQQYGISHNEKKTRDLIAKHKLKAVAKNQENPNDRRQGYLISGKAVYDLIVEEIPIMKDFLPVLRAQATTIKARGKRVNKNQNDAQKEE